MPNTGYRYDEETDVYYLNARYYDAKIARFMTEDTYRGEYNDPLSLNLYTYVMNNPLVYWDPTGHAAVTLGSKSKNDNEDFYRKAEEKRERVEKERKEKEEKARKQKEEEEKKKKEAEQKKKAEEKRIAEQKKQTEAINNKQGTGQSGTTSPTNTKALPTLALTALTAPAVKDSPILKTTIGITLTVVVANEANEKIGRMVYDYFVMDLSYGDLTEAEVAANKEKIEAEQKKQNAKLPNQGTVEGNVEGAPPVDAGKQGKHVPTHKNNNPASSQWSEGETGVNETQEAWLNGETLPDGTKIWDAGRPIGPNGETGVRVHIDGKGNIHGYPVDPGRYLK